VGDQLSPVTIARRPFPGSTAGKDAARRQQSRRVANALTDTKCDEALGDGEGTAELAQVIADILPSDVERFAGNAQRCADASCQVLCFAPSITPRVKEPFPELVCYRVVDLAWGEVSPQVNHGVRPSPSQRATTRKLAAISEPNAALTEQRDGEPD
jgi:hypothetical protein